MIQPGQFSGRRQFDFPTGSRFCNFGTWIQRHTHLSTGLWYLTCRICRSGSFEALVHHCFRCTGVDFSSNSDLVLPAAWRMGRCFCGIWLCRSSWASRLPAPRLGLAPCLATKEDASFHTWRFPSVMLAGNASSALSYQSPCWSYELQNERTCRGSAHHAQSYSDLFRIVTRGDDLWVGSIHRDPSLVPSLGDDERDYQVAYTCWTRMCSWAPPGET